MMVAVLGCANGCGFSKDREEAERLAEQYFSEMISGDMDAVLSLYSPQFYEVTSREEWRMFLENQRARCGTPQNYSLLSWNVFSSFGTNPGTRTTLVYDVQYTRCRVSEKMTLFKPSDGKMRIQGHFLTPKSGTQGSKGEVQAT